MRTFSDAKAMAKALRQGLGERDIDLSHSDCLELVARQFGFPDWNVLSALIASQKTVLRLPGGWLTTGSNPEHYEMGIDDSLPKGTALIRSRDTNGTVDGFGTLMQSLVADDFRGQRIRLSAELKAENVTGAVTLWLRVDGAEGQTLAFDNMEKRTTDGVLTGTAGWKRREIVLDVPPKAESLHFGFYLRGNGTAYVRAVELGNVDDTVGVTTPPRPPLSRPVNLGFAPTD